VTVKDPEGTARILTADPEVKRFKQVRQGDQVTVNYTEHGVLRARALAKPDA